MLECGNSRPHEGNVCREVIAKWHCRSEKLIHTLQHCSKQSNIGVTCEIDSECHSSNAVCANGSSGVFLPFIAFQPVHIRMLSKLINFLPSLRSPQIVRQCDSHESRLNWLINILSVRLCIIISPKLKPIVCSSMRK